MKIGNEKQNKDTKAKIKQNRNLKRFCLNEKVILLFFDTKRSHFALSRERKVNFWENKVKREG